MTILSWFPWLPFRHGDICQVIGTWCIRCVSFLSNNRKYYKSKINLQTGPETEPFNIHQTWEITTNALPLKVIKSLPRTLQKILQFTPKIRQFFIYQKYYRNYYKSFASQNNFVFTKKTTKNTTIHPRNSAILYLSKILQKLLQILCLS